VLSCGSISRVSAILRSERRRFLVFESKSRDRWEVATADTDRFGTPGSQEESGQKLSLQQFSEITKLY